MCSRDTNILYADDMVLVCVGTSLEELTEQVNNISYHTLEWCNYNNLSLNFLKSEFVAVTNKNLFARPQLFLG